MTTDSTDRRAELTPDQRALLDRWLQGQFPEEEAARLRPVTEGAQGLASFAQERLWFLERLHPGAPIYNEPLALHLCGALDAPALADALGRLVGRHEVLRTTYSMKDGCLHQIVAPPAPVPLPITDLQDAPAEERLSMATSHCVAESKRAFDLAAGPVFRARLFRIGEAEHVLLLVIHHIACDGWSLSILARELGAYYAAACRREPARLPELGLRYMDFAQWQRQWLNSRAACEARAALQARLSDVPTLALLTDHPRPPVQGHAGATHVFTLPAALSERLTSLCRARGVTLFMALLAGFFALLHRYTGQDDIAVGTPVAGRGRTELEPLVGFFVNMLVLRADLSAEPTFAELLERVREVTLAAHATAEFPFDKLVEALQPTRDPSRQPLFQVMFGLHNVAQSDLDLPGLHVSAIDIDRGASKFDLALYMVERPDGLRGLLEYSTDLFEAGTIARMASHLVRLLERMVDAPDKPISRVDLLAPEERRQLLETWNPRVKPSSDGACIHELIEAQAALRPDAPALATGDERISYAELNRRANLLAHRLRAEGVGPEVPVGICMQRSPGMILAVLAVLKAGGAYVPLDPAYPSARLALMLRESGASLLLTQRPTRGAFPETAARGHCIEDLVADARPEHAENPPPLACADHPAYVIFTSGSTGTPKGVVVLHRGLCAIVEAETRAFEVGPESRLLQYASLSFDASAAEIFRALTAGATLWLGPPEPVLAGPALARLLAEAEISVVTLPPSVLATLEPTDLPALRVLAVAGEACPAALVRKWAKGRRFLNVYGPTETSIGATFWVCDDPDLGGGRSPPIGRPFPHVAVYVLDHHQQPVPIGVPAEVYIGGHGVARGYLNRPEWTAERFLPDPFAGDPSARMYRTGDRARYLPDGTLEFLGRTDGQVKLRGMRVDLGEIEAVLQDHPAVQQAVVQAHEDAPGEMRLCAYVELGSKRAGDAEAIAELRRSLSERLPRHFVPSAFVLLDEVPRTPSGKVDRGALPRPDRGRSDERPKKDEPRDEIEGALVQIWEETIGVRPIGIRDDFFALGGHSLLAVRLLNRIRQRFDRDLPIAQLLQFPTVEHLAHLLRQGDSSPPRTLLVPLRANGDEPAFFCVHPVGGNVLCYVELARTLGPERPFYGIVAPGLQGERQPCTSIEQMAALYIEAMRERQPHGPYLLGGWSMGGCIAFEMANQLVAMGEEVALLALFDTHAPTPIDLPDGIDEVALVSLLVSDLAQQAEQPMPPGLEEALERTEPHARRQVVLASARAAGLLPPDVEPAQLDPLIAVFEANVLAHCRYRPTPYSGRITLLRAGDPNAWDAGSPDLGWGDLARGGIDLEVIPATHYSLLRRHVGALAERLRMRLSAAVRQGRDRAAS